MSIMPDTWIREMSQKHGMIEPFVESQKRDGVISYGVSSYGYDARVSPEFKIFTNVDSAVVDPKEFNPKSFVDREADERGGEALGHRHNIVAVVARQVMCVHFIHECATP